jgi:hypothetical protein
LKQELQFLNSHPFNSRTTLSMNINIHVQNKRYCRTQKVPMTIFKAEYWY